jgi:predicted DCC family thiol-disulfide oxidoreductase YuxK
MDGAVTPVLIYDGDCGFCTASAAWITARWAGPKEGHAVPSQQVSQAERQRLGLSAADLDRAAWWVEGTRTWGGHLAVGRALMAAGGGWRLLGRAMFVPPARQVAAVGYRVVARYRHRLPGGTPACRT